MVTIKRLNGIYWKMIYRCCNTHCGHYKRYGGRGITICEEWLCKEKVGKYTKGWLSFEKWALENGYSDDLSIDRKDVNKGYSPENCRWVTMKVQQNNRRDNHFVTYKGKTQTLTQWCEELNLDYDKTQMRINKLHWTIEKALEYKSDCREKLITYNGKSQSLIKWCEELNLKSSVVYSRLTKYKWSVKRALETKTK